jgi:iron complex transport system ATP-binding protein
MSALCAEGVVFGYGSSFRLDIPTLTLEPGSMSALLGPNGSGKTTLLKLLSGVRAPERGGIRLFDKEVSGQARRAIARQLAVVPQKPAIPFAFTVFEIAMLGRTPYARLLRDESKHDREAVERALELTRLGGLADHAYHELSGGEQQRVLLAMALAQEPRVLILDEPTTHLDIAFQVQMLDLLRSLNQSTDLTVLAAMHDLNLAALYFPRLLLMRSGRVVADGTPTDVLSVQMIRDVYGAETVLQQHPTRGVPQVLPQPRA